MANTNSNSVVMPSLGLLGAVVALIFSIIFLPVLMGGWALGCVVGSIVGIIGAIFVLISRLYSNCPAWINSGKNIVCGIGLGLFLLVFVIWGSIYLAQIFAAKQGGQTAAPKQTASTVNNNNNQIQQNPIAATHVGIDQPSKGWTLVKAGSVISGDVCIFDNDNNSKKTPIYDSQENTADIIYTTQDIYIWHEWGCHIIENANAQDVATLINDKLTNGNFAKVRFFNGYSKLGTNTPNLVTSKIDASGITLTAVAATQDKTETKK